MADKNIVTIEKFDHYGRGIAKLENIPVFVWDSVIFDKVEIDYIKSKKNYKEAIIKKVISPSSLRVDNPCIYNDKCGGCALLNISYKESLNFKESKVKEIISKFSKMDIKVNSIIFDRQFNYRNKIILHVDGKNIGLYEKRTNNIVGINKCLLLDSKMNDMISRIKSFIKNYNHNINEVMIRSNGNDIMMKIKGNCNLDVLKREFKDIYSLWLNNKLIIGNKDLIMKLCNYSFYVLPDSFFQVNLLVAEMMFKYIINYIKEKNYNHVLDLYCGVGVIGILISSYVNKVTGIEVVSDAIVNANINKQLNNIKNISFICGKTEDYIDSFSYIDLVIVDPPRKGLDKKTIENIIRIKPKDIVYVSCDTITLARDIKLLSEFYNVIELTPFDMFPNTYHVECVCLLNRR